MRSSLRCYIDLFKNESHDIEKEKWRMWENGVQLECEGPRGRTGILKEMEEQLGWCGSGELSDEIDSGDKENRKRLS